MQVYITDTMALILWLEKRKMPQKVKEIFTKAENKEATICIPALVLSEIGYLSEKQRIELTLKETIFYIRKHDNFSIHPLTDDLITAAFEITDIPELHDRLISASARLLNHPIVTNDPKIIASRFVSTLWG